MRPSPSMRSCGSCCTPRTPSRVPPRACPLRSFCSRACPRGARSPSASAVGSSSDECSSTTVWSAWIAVAHDHAVVMGRSRLEARDVRVRVVPVVVGSHHAAGTRHEGVNDLRCRSNRRDSGDSQARPGDRRRDADHHHRRQARRPPDPDGPGDRLLVRAHPVAGDDLALPAGRHEDRSFTTK